MFLVIDFNGYRLLVIHIDVYRLLVIDTNGYGLLVIESLEYIRVIKLSFSLPNLSAISALSARK